MKKRFTFIKTLLVAVALTTGANVWAQTTWNFLDASAWGSVTLNGGNQYDESASTVATGGVTFTGTSGFVSTAKGIGFKATGSTSNENISIVVPVGYKAAVSIYTSSNRTVVADFDGATQTYNAGWASTTKEFDNEKGTKDITLYLYCNQNPGGSEQNKAPFLEQIVLTDMTKVKVFPWSADAVATIGGTKTVLKTYNSTADVAEGSEYTIGVDKVLEYNGDFYALNDDAFKTNVFGVTYKMGSTAGAHEFNYEKVDGAVFFGEIEDIYKEGVKAVAHADNNVLSNGGGYSAMGTEGHVTVTFNVPTAGVYNLILGMNNTNDKERGFNYSIDDAEVSATISVTKYSAYVHEIENEYLTAGEHTLTMNITYSLTPVFDYLLVTEGESTVSATIGAAGYATFIAPYALDFSGVTGLKAYTASLTGTTVTLKQVDDVPAGTGVVLEGAANTYSIPVIGSSTTEKGDLKGSNTDAKTADGNQYVLALQGSDVQFTLVNDGTEIAAGKAYLEKAAGVRSLSVVKAGEATAIKAIETEAAAGEVYNLAGQRVAAPQKGLYIVGGKKIIK